MVLGMKTKNNRRGPTVQIDYLIHIQEIKPWPPSQSLRSLRSVLIQWENGERNSGSTNLAVPSLGSVIGEGKIEFNESYRLPVALSRDLSVRGGEADVFQKNCLEFNMYEPRRDKTVRGQLLGTAILDLAEYGVLKEALRISVPMKCKRSYKNTEQPLLFVEVHPVEKARVGSLLRENNGGQSVSALMNEEYAEEAEIASFTDDDSSQSSVVVTSAVESTGLEENEQDVKNNKERIVDSKKSLDKLNMRPQDAPENPGKSSLRMSPMDVPSDLGTPTSGHASMSYSRKLSSVTAPKHFVFPSSSSSPPTLLRDHLEKDSKTSTGSSDYGSMDQEVHEQAANYRNIVTDAPAKGSEGTEDELFFEQSEKDHMLSSTSSNTCLLDGGNIGINTIKGNILRSERLKQMNSVRSPADLNRSTESIGSNHLAELKNSGVVGDAQNSGGNIRISDRKDAKVYPKEARSAISDTKIQHLENKVKMLEGELREAAAIEAALYSVVAEHGSSMSKVHAPARRLSRLYLHSWKENVQSRRAGAARSAVSGLVLVAKACGNDVPRLTFWLSNSIVLRTIICQTTKHEVSSVPAGFRMKRKSEADQNGKITPSTRWKEFSPKKHETTSMENGGFGNWGDSHLFISSLEKVEAWIFSRIVVSIWWQILTPRMQPFAGKVTDKNRGSASIKSFRKTSSSPDHDQGDFSLNIWKTAFREACERICPVRAGGHECGCLPILSKSIMEQCVERLDVAMFNAILRESADEIPTDPVSDPITDHKVLPIPPGKSSFGAGAKLKNAIGNWSRWLTDLFGMDDDDSHEDKDDNDGRQDASFKSFHLLHSLSDLLMLPKDMLLSQSIRKEVCPMFSAQLIKKILNNFVPDEFCPDPIPTAVVNALDSEDDLEKFTESVKNLPCIAAPIIYLPPAATTIATIIGEVGSESQLRRSRSSVLRKAYTSDDELNELNSPLSSIFHDGPVSLAVSRMPSSWKSKKTHTESAVRYELLKAVWINSE